MSQHATTEPIDWQQVYRRLEAVKAGIEMSLSPSGEDKKKILRARGRALAGTPQVQTTAASVLAVEFSLAYETYGIEALYIREVCPLRELAILPGVPRFVVGIINVRGQIVSVVDIKKFFGLPEKGLTDLNKVIIISRGELEFGVLADVVLGIRTIPVGEIQSAPPTLTGIRADYVRGVTPERIIILDGGKLLTDRKLIVHEEIK